MSPLFQAQTRKSCSFWRRLVTCLPSEHQKLTFFEITNSRLCTSPPMKMDEDRPNKCADFIYDTARRHMFGRYEDIETVIIIKDEVHFPGTYSADQKWKTRFPAHHDKIVKLSEFEKSEEGRPIFWINTWNHLIGEKNNNTEMPLVLQKMQPVGGIESMKEKYFVVRKGSREEVDAQFKGMITSFATVMPPERRQKLGKRVF